LAKTVQFNGTATSNVGTYSTVFAAADVTSYTDWADWKSLYQEFRVVGLRVKLIPKFALSELGAMANAAGTAGISYAQNVTPLYLCRSHGEVTAITSSDIAVNHESYTVTSVNQMVECQIKMSETDEAQWSSTQGETSSVMCIKSWCQWQTIGTTDATVFGNFIIVQAVQFRGRVATAVGRRQTEKTITVEKDSKDLPKEKEKSQYQFKFDPNEKLKDVKTKDDWYEMTMQEEREMREEFARRAQSKSATPVSTTTKVVLTNGK